MKKGITIFSIFISLFVFGLFAVPQQSEASFWDNFSISLGFDIGNGGYNNNYGYDDYGYDNSYDNYGYDNYGYDSYGYDDYGYDNNYGYDSYNSGYDNYGYNGGYYNNVQTISPTRGFINNNDYYYNSYDYSRPVCMTRGC